MLYKAPGFNGLSQNTFNTSDDNNHSEYFDNDILNEELRVSRLKILPKKATSIILTIG